MPLAIDVEEAGVTIWDVIVIGAGPAGAMAARALAIRGWEVLLVDRATFPRHKVCGCCLNRHALSALEAAGLEDLPAKLGAVPLDRVKLASGGRSATVRLPGGLALSREALDLALIAEAEVAGATFLPGTRVHLNESEAGTDCVSLTNGMRAKAVIVADGLNGRAGADAPRVKPGSRIGAGAILPHAPDEYEAGTIFMASGRGGYVGLVRLEDGKLDIAAAFDAKLVRERGLAGAAMGILRSSGLPELPGLPDGDWKGTPPLTRGPVRVAGPRWFAIGDAAGYIEPFTGEGMAWAMASALAATPLVERCVQHGPANLDSEWAALHRTCVGRRQWTCRAMAWTLKRPTLCSLAVRGLRLIPALAIPVVRSLNRPLAPLPGVR